MAPSDNDDDKPDETEKEFGFSLVPLDDEPAQSPEPPPAQEEIEKGLGSNEPKLNFEIDDEPIDIPDEEPKGFSAPEPTAPKETPKAPSPSPPPATPSMTPSGGNKAPSGGSSFDDLPYLEPEAPKEEPEQPAELPKFSTGAEAPPPTSPPSQDGNSSSANRDAIQAPSAKGGSQAGGDKKRVRIGDLLVEKELITEAQLKLALQEQKQTGKKIGRTLIDMGMVPENKLLEALSQHLNMPFVEMRHFQIDHSLSITLQETYARRFRSLLLSKKNDGFMVGMADPLDLLAQDEIQRILQAPIYPAVVRESELLATLDIIYRKHEEIQEIADELDSELSESDFDIDELAVGTETSDAPVVRLLQSILEDAVQVKASDIHIEPDEVGLRVRMRVDGVLQEQVMKEKRIASALVLRLKIMSNLDISEKRLPQDGRFNIKVMNRSIDVRLSTMPAQYGEVMVMRLLDQTAGILSLDTLGMPEDIRDRFILQIERPHGLILVTGPTGSGKTTTLYAGLSHLNTPQRKIITAEDPVEYRMARINQVQVNTKINLTFASILRSSLRQDPDVILIGEMRDMETVQIAVRAALTGHLVFSTLHTNDAISSAMRLADMGVEPWLVASALRGVVAQRLIKKICPHCKEEHSPTAQEKMWLEQIQRGEMPMDTKFYQGAGCYQCNNTGYSGRIGVYEFLELNDDLLNALRKNDTHAFTTAAEHVDTFIPMSKRALMYATQGITDLHEVFRITSDLEFSE